MKRRAVIDESIGETRAVVYEGRKPVELYVRRWSDAERPRLGDIFTGRIDQVDLGMGAAFVALNFGKPGFLKFTDAPKAPRFQVGQYVQVKVTREDEPGKGPVLRFLKLAETKKIGPVSQLSLKDRISNRFGSQIAFETAPISEFSPYCIRDIGLTGGGDICIEQTRAMVAIDVDRGSGKSGFDVSLTAASEIARQVRLRGLGGLLAIDFPNLRQKRQREQLITHITEAFKPDINLVKIAPLSRFGVLEMTRQKQYRSVDDILLDGHGEPTAETLALAGLRRLEKEARVTPGAKMTLIVPEQAHDWLNMKVINWQDPLMDRIGARFAVETGHSIDVKADR